jgi:hypothetical protein
MITFYYKCRCMAEEVALEVRNRRHGEDVGEWMHHVVQLAMTTDHMTRSPRCRAATVEYAKLPMAENTPYIGGEPKLDS